MFWYHPVYNVLNYQHDDNSYIQNLLYKLSLVDTNQNYIRAHPKFGTNNLYQIYLIFANKHQNNS